jgi:hypothetical protein
LPDLLANQHLKSNLICQSIFNHLLTKIQKPRSLSFKREFKNICVKLDMDKMFVIENIVNIINKEDTLKVEDNNNNKLIRQCLNDNSNPNIRIKLNLITYAGSSYFNQIINNSI